jgi:hypothetical protein
MDFLDAPAAALPEIINRTGDAADDATVRRWALADLRRLQGDNWASDNLRMDVVNADVFGPPGLNGTDVGIRRHTSEGLLAVRCPPPNIVKAAVVRVPVALQKAVTRDVGLTDFVVVLMYRGAAEGCERIHRDGSRDTLPPHVREGAFSWQLDSGEFRTDPVVGDLWYQARGWTCRPDPGDVIGSLCGVIGPTDEGDLAARLAESPFAD